MDLQRKIEIVNKSIAHITRADDTDSAVREAALGAIEKFIADERKAMGERVAAKIKSHLGVVEEAAAT